VQGQDRGSFERRLDAVETSNRRWRYAALLLGLGVLIVTSVAADRPAEDRIPDVIYARKFVAVNERNEPVAFMGSEKNTGMVSIAASDGTLLFAASATESGHGIVSTFDRQGRALVCFGANRSGDGHVAVYDEHGKDVSQPATTQAVSSRVPAVSP
jgi:hypothetical protein